MAESPDEADAARLDEIRWLTLALSLPGEGVEARFESDEAARARLGEVRWPSGPTCPRCGSREVIALSTRPVLKCRACKHQFTATVGTPLQGSRIGPLSWFITTEQVILTRRRRAFRQSGPTHGYILLEDLAAMLGVNHERACRVRSVVVKDLARGGEGLLSRCLCVLAVEVPANVEVGPADHLQWLEEKWRLDPRWRW